MRAQHAALRAVAACCRKMRSVPPVGGESPRAPGGGGPSLRTSSAGRHVQNSPSIGLPERSTPTTPRGENSEASATVSNAASAAVVTMGGGMGGGTESRGAMLRGRRRLSGEKGASPADRREERGKVSLQGARGHGCATLVDEGELGRAKLAAHFPAGLLKE